MKMLALLLILVVSIATACADDTRSKVGVITRDLQPPEPFDWRGAKTHRLRTIIWYPATETAREEVQWVGPPLFPLYSAGRASVEATPAAGTPRPLIVMSHGFGGSASDLGWLGTALAASGFIVAGVDHPGNNALEEYTVEGFSLMWLRAVDLSAVIDALLSDPTLGRQIDHSRIGVAGHSLGGYTIISAVGGITDPTRIEAFCRSDAADALCNPAASVSELRQQRMVRLDSDPEFKRRYSQAGNSYLDTRIRAVFAMAPGLIPIFTRESLDSISVPTAIVSGSADEITPTASGAEALAKAIPRATLKLFPGAGHFVFFGSCTLIGRIFMRTICADRAGIDRDAVHAETIRLAREFFSSNLR